MTRPGDGAPAADGSDEAADPLQALVGKPLGAGKSVAPDPVNLPMIRHWCAAFDDRNPVYTDPEAAAASRFGQIVAPPFMLQTWTMPTPTIAGLRERGGAPTESRAQNLLAALDEYGYTATLATNSEYDIVRYVHLGEVLSSSTVLESISEEKRTRIGRGRFVTWLTTYADDAGEVVATQRFRIYRFAPGSQSA
jgi:acyl dehydratase